MQIILILDTLTKTLIARANQVLIIAAKEMDKDEINIDIINSAKKKDKKKEDNLDKYID